MWYHGLSPHKVSCADRSDPPGAAHGGKEAQAMIDASFDAPKRLLHFAAFCGSQRSVRQCFTKRSYVSFVLYLCGMLVKHRRLSIQSF